MGARYIETDDGTRLAVYEEGNAGGPTVILVHGWPDSHVVWDGVVALLANDYRIIRYDNRGAGGSSVPEPVSAYALARLAEDFATVADELCPDSPVHVVGHDWGAATMWEYLSRPEAADRVASYTSISGPDPQHLSRFVRDGLSRPYQPRRFARALSQALHFSYMIGFSVPVLMPTAMRAFLARAINRWFIAPGLPPQHRQRADTYVADATNGLKIYRANFFGALMHAVRDRFVSVPVQLIVNTEDIFVRPYVYDDTSRWVPRLWRRDIRAGHWSPVSHPQVVATAVTELISHLNGAPASPALSGAHVARSLG
jgi:pimeloyl-ACP methyl ester carboxylesterase